MTVILGYVVLSLPMMLAWATMVVIVWRLADENDSSDHGNGGGGPGEREPAFGPSWPGPFARRRAGPEDLAGSA
jgi:hypothetical protein